MFTPTSNNTTGEYLFIFYGCARYGDAALATSYEATAPQATFNRVSQFYANYVRQINKRLEGVLRPIVWCGENELEQLKE